MDDLKRRVNKMDDLKRRVNKMDDLNSVIIAGEIRDIFKNGISIKGKSKYADTGEFKIKVVMGHLIQESIKEKLKIGLKVGVVGAINGTEKDGFHSSYIVANHIDIQGF